ncbi:ligand-binding protein SH3, partial [Stenotrophomonas sp. KAs 5-3]
GAAAAPAAAPAPVQAAPAAPAEATTAPLQNVPQNPPPQQQGFQPVNDGEIRTETLGGN